MKSEKNNRQDKSEKKSKQREKRQKTAIYYTMFFFTRWWNNISTGLMFYLHVLSSFLFLFETISSVYFRFIYIFQLKRVSAGDLLTPRVSFSCTIFTIERTYFCEGGSEFRLRTCFNDVCSLKREHDNVF